jgi:hypothetical protein
MHSELVAALLGREVRATAPTIKQFSVPQGSSFDLVPEGTMGFVVSKDARALRNIGDAIDAGDLPAAMKLTRKSQAQYKRLLLTNKRVVAALEDVPIFGELRYAGMPLIQGIFIPGRVPLAVSRILYSGGQFDPSLFEFVEKVRPDAGAGDALSGLVLVREPDLSALERRVLARVPATSVDQIFHPGGPLLFTAVIAAAATRAVEFVVAEHNAVAFGLLNDCYFVIEAAGLQNDLIARASYAAALAGSQIDNLDPEQAVGKLLKLRVEALVNAKR